MPKNGPQCEVIGGFERTRKDERQSEDEQGALKQQTGDDGAGR